jgi:hypothetical protein
MLNHPLPRMRLFYAIHLRGMEAGRIEGYRYQDGGAQPRTLALHPEGRRSQGCHGPTSTWSPTLSSRRL